MFPFSNLKSLKSSDITNPTHNPTGVPSIAKWPTGVQSLGLPLTFSALTMLLNRNMTDVQNLGQNESCLAERLRTQIL